MKILTALILCWFTVALPARAHPSHTSFAEVGWSEGGDALEISLRVIPEDLENVLGLREGRVIALRDTRDHRSLIAAWLAEAFVVTAGERSMPLQLVGLELGYDETWIYFTVSATRAQPLVLSNSVMHRYNRERGQLQINQVQRLWSSADDRMTFTDTEPQLLWPGAG